METKQANVICMYSVEDCFGVTVDKALDVIEALKATSILFSL